MNRFSSSTKGSAASERNHSPRCRATASDCSSSGRVDFDAHVVRIEETLSEASGRLFTNMPKTAAGRRVSPLPRDLEIALWDHLRREQRAGPPDAFVFQGPKGGLVRRTQFRSRVWSPA